MQVSDELALEIQTIISVHVASLMVLCLFCAYILRRARRTPVLNAYLAAAACLFLWMASKILKTVSPTVELRWIFILTQYIGAQFLGYCLLVFAFVYKTGASPGRKRLVWWALPPVLSYLVVLTNPMHMLFYSYFDIYRDRFGVLFYPTQFIAYLYILIGVIWLSSGYTKQEAFRNRRSLGRLFAGITLLPLLLNVYYILFKARVFGWIFPFPIFDITPVSGTVALLLFILPALRYRFFDLVPISFQRIYADLPVAEAILRSSGTIYGGNRAFTAIFGSPRELDGLLAALINPEAAAEQLLSESGMPFETRTDDGRVFRMDVKRLNKRERLLSLTDITDIAKATAEISRQNKALTEANRHLDDLSQNVRELARVSAREKAAQDTHDILGHSLTVVIGTLELAAGEKDSSRATEKLTLAGDMLRKSLSSLKGALAGGEITTADAPLIKALEGLRNEKINVDLNIQGSSYELTGEQTDAVYSLCREAVTNAIRHGDARNIHLILRYGKEGLELYAIDDGIGCKEIVESFGLRGIKRRMEALRGSVYFGSDGEKGFTVNGFLPRF